MVETDYHFIAILELVTIVFLTIILVASIKWTEKKREREIREIAPYEIARAFFNDVDQFCMTSDTTDTESRDIYIHTPHAIPLKVIAEAVQLYDGWKKAAGKRLGMVGRRTGTTHQWEGNR